MGRRMTDSRTKRTPELVARCKRLRDRGLSHSSIGRIVRVSASTVQRWIDPEYDARCKAMKVKVIRISDLEQGWKDPRLAKDEIHRRKPQSHVTLTAALMGDPAPGRSALDTRNN